MYVWSKVLNCTRKTTTLTAVRRYFWTMSTWLGIFAVSISMRKILCACNPSVRCDIVMMVWEWVHSCDGIRGPKQSLISGCEKMPHSHYYCSCVECHIYLKCLEVFEIIACGFSAYTIKIQIEMLLRWPSNSLSYLNIPQYVACHKPYGKGWLKIPFPPAVQFLWHQEHANCIIIMLTPS